MDSLSVLGSLLGDDLSERRASLPIYTCTESSDTLEPTTGGADVLTSLKEILAEQEYDRLAKDDKPRTKQPEPFILQTQGSAPRLCNLCWTLCNEHLHYLLLDPQHGHRRVWHHETYAALETTAVAGCQLCSMLLANMKCCPEDKCTCAEWWESSTLPHHMEMDQSAESHPFVIRLDWWTAHDALGDQGEFAGYLVCERPGLPIVKEWSHDALPEPHPARLHITCFAQDRYNIAHRVISPYPDFALAQTWLLTCGGWHSECEIPLSKVLPTRVVQISSDETGATRCRLLETEGARGRYMTLSHCWGDTQPLRTLRINYASHLLDIPVDSLPATFRDAVLAAQGLGVRYLWIDSLCIVQNDAEDWQRESATMGAIYANSYLTIIGPAAKDANAGFLRRRSVPENILEVAVRDPIRNIKTAILQFIPVQSDINESVPAPEVDPPINTRAWTLQERLLSPRVLYFGSKQMYMTCPSGDFFETHNYAFKRSTTEWSPAMSMFSIWRWGATSELTSLSWRHLIEEYTSRSLSFGRDSLPALSGLAAKYADGKEDEYLAGLWRSQLAGHLLWQSSPTRNPTNDNVHAKPRARVRAKYAGPSWSWCSSPSAVSYYGTTFASNDSEALWNFADDFEVLDAFALPTGFVPYGEVATARLTVRGLAREYLLEKNPLEKEPQSLELTLVGFKDGESDGIVFLDAHAEIVARDAVLCMPCSVGQGRLNAGTMALILKEVHGKKATYVRVGIAKMPSGYLTEGSAEAWRSMVAHLI